MDEDDAPVALAAQQGGLSSLGRGGSPLVKVAIAVTLTAREGAPPTTVQLVVQVDSACRCRRCNDSLSWSRSWRFPFLGNFGASRT